MEEILINKIDVTKTFNGQLVEHTDNWYDSTIELLSDYNAFVNYYLRLTTLRKNNGEDCSFSEEQTETGRKMVYTSSPCDLKDNEFKVEIAYASFNFDDEEDD